jgi:hypothetical protein
MNVFGKNKLRIIFSHSVRREHKLFAEISRLRRYQKAVQNALESDHTCSILLTGPPASAKTISTIVDETKRFLHY